MLHRIKQRLYLLSLVALLVVSMDPVVVHATQSTSSFPAAGSTIVPSLTTDTNANVLLAASPTTNITLSAASIILSGKTILAQEQGTNNSNTGVDLLSTISSLQAEVRDLKTSLASALSSLNSTLATLNSTVEMLRQNSVDARNLSVIDTQVVATVARMLPLSVPGGGGSFPGNALAHFVSSVNTSLAYMASSIQAQIVAVNTSVSGEVSRAVSAEASLATSDVQVASSLSSSITAQVAKTNISLAALSQQVLSPAIQALVSPGTYLTSQVFSCVPSSWSSTLSTGSNVGCSVAVTLPGPSIVMAMLTGYSSVTSSWLLVGISLNGDNPLSSNPYPNLNTGAQFSLVHTYSTVGASTRTARAAFFNGGTVTIQARFLCCDGTCSASGYSIQGLVISAPSLNPSVLSSSNAFGCQYSSWEYPISVGSNGVVCSSAISLPYSSLVWSYFGGPNMQTSTGTSYGYVTANNEVLPPAVDYATVNSAVSQATMWAIFSSARVFSMSSGAHTVHLNTAAATGSTAPRFNGGAMQGFYIPRDLSQPTQTFFCQSVGPVSISTSVITLCTTNITLPYRAAVWAEFTSAARAPSSAGAWVMGSIDFDGDAIGPLQRANTAEAALLALGTARSYKSGEFNNFGQGRVKVMAAGAHVISFLAVASTATASITTISMDGFFVPN